jgi:hypothetical protein
MFEIEIGAAYFLAGSIPSCGQMGPSSTGLLKGIKLRNYNLYKKIVMMTERSIEVIHIFQKLIYLFIGSLCYG